MFSQPKILLKRALHSRVFGHSAQSFPERMMHNTLQVFVRKRDLYLWGSFARKTYYLGRLYHVVWPFTGHCPQESPISFLGSFAKEICTEPSNRCHPGWVMSHLSRIPHDPLSHTASWPIITHCDMSLHNVATPHQLLWAETLITCGRVIGCLIFMCHFPPKSPTISASSAKNDLQLKASYGSSLPCSRRAL